MRTPSADACKRLRPRGRSILNPTLPQFRRPTTISEPRRIAIVAIAAPVPAFRSSRDDPVWILAHQWGRPPFGALAPDLTWHVAGLAKMSRLAGPAGSRTWWCRTRDPAWLFCIVGANRDRDGIAGHDCARKPAGSRTAPLRLCWWPCARKSIRTPAGFGGRDLAGGKLQGRPGPGSTFGCRCPKSWTRSGLCGSHCVRTGNRCRGRATPSPPRGVPPRSRYESVSVAPADRFRGRRRPLEFMAHALTESPCHRLHVPPNESSPRFAARQGAAP